MNFDFSDDQRMLRDQAARFLDQRGALGAARKVLEGEAPYDESLWKGIGELGWAGTAIPEAYGGSGLGRIELCVIAEELGRSLAPTPFSSSVYLAAEALLEAGSEEQKKAWLPKLAEGKAIGCFGLGEGIAPPTARHIRASVSGGKLTGTKAPVADGDVADVAVVVARGAGEPGLYLVDLTAGGVTRTKLDTVDPSRSHAELAFDGAPAEPLGGGTGGGWEAVQRVLDRAAVLFAFEQVGGAQAALDMAKDYALNRYAFGRPIGSYQGIKHKLADMYMKIELARANALYGAWAIGCDAPELPVAAAAARISATDASWFAAKENIQTHGGMGFTWELDCHLFYRRAKLLALNLGSERLWKDRLVSLLETQNAPKQAA